MSGPEEPTPPVEPVSGAPSARDAQLVPSRVRPIFRTPSSTPVDDGTGRLSRGDLRKTA